MIDMGVLQRMKGKHHRMNAIRGVDYRSQHITLLATKPNNLNSQDPQGRNRELTPQIFL